MRNEKRKKGIKQAEEEKRKRGGHQDGQKKRLEEMSFCRNGERERFESGSVQSAEVHGSPEQTLANRGAVVRVRVDLGRGQQHQDVKCDRSILGLQYRNPSLL